MEIVCFLAIYVVYLINGFKLSLFFHLVITMIIIVYIHYDFLNCLQTRLIGLGESNKDKKKLI